MSNKYWVGGTGNWSDTTHWSTASGGAGSAGVPTSADSIFFDALSFAAASQIITVDVTANCLDMTWTGATNTPTLAGSAALSIFGNLILIAAMTYTYSGTVTFTATTTGKTVTTNGLSLVSILTFNGIGGSWTFQDNITTSAGITLNNGTLNTNGKSVACAQFVSNSGATRTLTLGSSSINVNNNWTFTNTTGLTFNANTSTVQLLNDGIFDGGGLTYNKVIFNGMNITVTGSNTFSTFFDVGPRRVLSLTSGTTQTVTNISSSANNTDRGTLQSTIAGSPAIISTGSTINQYFLIVQDITKAGTGSITFNLSQNVSGNTGITFHNNLYWIGGSGNWGSTAKWSQSSGGPVINGSPASFINAYFDANSFTAPGQSVYMNLSSGAACLDLNWTGVTNNPNFQSPFELSVCGSLTLASVMTINITGRVTLSSTSLGNTVTTNGKTMAQVYFDGVGGGWTLQDDLNTGTWEVELDNGSLNTNGKTITCNSMAVHGTGPNTVTLGASTLNLSYWYFSTTTGLTFNAGTSTINMTSAGATFNGGGLTYYNVTFTNNSTITGSNTFNQLTLVAGKILNVTAGTTQTISALGAVGSVGNLIILQSTTAGTLYTLKKPTGKFVVNYCSIKDCTASTPMDAYNSTDVSGNTGVTFQAGNPVMGRYWVGGTGNWSSTGQWSTVSGGAGGASIPTPTDNVYFDINSFTGAGQVVTVDTSGSCLDINWTGVTNVPTLAGTQPIHIYGNLTFISAMTVTNTGSLNFDATSTGKTITTAGISISSGFTFNGVGGGWTLQDNLLTTSSIYLWNGIFNTNNKTINCYTFNSYSSNTRTLILGSSIITCSNNWTVPLATGLTFNIGTSTINMTGNSGTFDGGGLTYNNVVFAGTPITVISSNTYANLTLTAGKTVNFTSGTTQTVSNLIGWGSSGNLITIQSSTAGTPATISKSSGTLALRYTSLKDITGTGGATFKVVNGTNVSGNTGWTFSVETFIGQLGPVTSSVAGFMIPADKIKLDGLSTTTTSSVFMVSTAGQTVFTVAGGYPIGLLNMYINGVRLRNGNDFTATDGTTVVLATSVIAGQEIEFEIFTYAGMLPSVPSFNGRTGNITMISADITNALGFTPMKKYSTSIGDGASTSITVTHNFNTLDVTVQVYEISTAKQVFVDITMTSVNVVTISGFTVVPTANQYRVVIIG
jgi:hypothetical protein